MSLNEGEVYFKLVSDDIDPDEITKLLGMQPTKVRKKAQPIPKYNSWEYSSGKEVSEVIDVYKMSSAVIAALEPKAEEIAKIVKEKNLIAELQVVLWISMDDSISIPAIGFEKETVAFLAKVGASIDVDTYRN
jgi:hypothetical protein